MKINYREPYEEQALKLIAKGYRLLCERREREAKEISEKKTDMKGGEHIGKRIERGTRQPDQATG